MAKLSTYAVNCEYKWYAIYTRLNHEKVVEKNLKENNIDVYLPKRKVLKTWSDRKKWIEEPLFRPYVFVRVCNKEYHKVLQIPSVLNYIHFEGKAASLPDEQVELIKNITYNDLDFETSQTSFDIGQQAEVINGSLKGWKGEVINFRGKSRLRILIGHLNYSIIVDIDNKYLKSF